MTRRQEQLNSQMMEILSTVVQSEMQDPRLQMLNVTRIQVNRDASHAMIYVVSLDKEHTPEEIETALGHAKGFLRSVLAQTLDLRHTPDLTFRYDKAAEGTERIMSLFDQIAEERSKNPPHFDEEPNE
ncbi:MAG: 30S ribosome-binding factor RbfA [Ardenticatenales bacterium]|nr:30S ribosome-binding factor RbfA [Ardenticatenales bacterium]